MMPKIRSQLQAYREQILYLFFGGLTTAVDWSISFLLYRFWIDAHSPIAGAVHLADLFAWLAAVLFAFFTNRAFVFKDADKKANIWKQMAEFFGGRILTFVLFEYLLNLGVVMLLGVILPEQMEILTVDISAYRGAGIEVVAMGAASVANIVANYLIGKFLVFKKAKKQPEGDSEQSE